MNVRITADSAPALGTIRHLAGGDVVWISADAIQRADWGRYQDAIGQAIARGAEVRRLNG